MKKSLVSLGAIVGFIVGSRAGRGPYEHLEAKGREFSRKFGHRSHGTMPSTYDPAEP